MKHADKILGARTVNSIFVGDALSFSDTMMSLVEAEFPCLALVRVATIDDLLSMKRMRSNAVRMIVVDALMSEELTEALSQLRAAFPGTCIALAYRQPEMARRLLGQLQSAPSWGNVGFLPMNTNLDCWLSIVRLLASGECYVPAELLVSMPCASQALPSSIQPQPNDADHVNLTERELQVLESAASGKQNKIIANDLQLSQHTVKLHMHHIIAKLGVNNRTEAANWFHSRKFGF